MKEKDQKHCPTADKYSYSSEAKATRALTRYDEIKRIYFCEHCEGYHSTSMDEETSESFGYLEQKPEITSEDVEKRLQALLNKKR
jgi:hypothetical protein